MSDSQATSAPLVRAPPKDLRRFGTRILYVGGVAWLVAPIVGLVILTLLSSRIELVEPKTTWVPVAANEANLSEPIDVVLDWAPERSLYAPAWGGVVQSVYISSGSRLRSGDPVVLIDGISRLAAHTPIPLSRPIARGDSGPEVEALVTFLATTGRTGLSGASLDYATLRAVRDFAASIGVSQASSVQAFDPAWIVYLPAEEVTVRALELKVGTLAPGPGSAIAELTPSLDRARLVRAGTFPEQQADRPPEPQLVEALVTAGEAADLLVGGSTVLLTENRQEVAAEDLDALAELLDSSAWRVDARLVTEASAGQWKVPVASVVTSASGTPCVVVGGEHHPRSVQVIVSGSSGGSVIVSGELSVTDVVAVRPPTANAHCDS